MTSRNEVEIAFLVDIKGPHFTACTHSYQGGAHGVIATGQDAFAAPIGIDGLLIVSVTGDREIQSRIVQLANAPLNFYRVVRLGCGPNGDVLACAARKDGLLVFCLADGRPQGQLVQHRFGESDIIDACSIGDSTFPHALACISREREFFLMRDALGEEPSLARNLPDSRGSAYSILSSRGSLFLLTDQHLATLPDVARRFLDGEDLDAPINVSLTPTKASEIFLRGDRSVLLVEEVIAEYAIDELLSGLSNHQLITHARRGPETREVEDSVVNTRMRPVAAGTSSIRRLDFKAA